MSERYSNGSYLQQNTDWHQEDSPYKAGLVMKALDQSHVTFNTCADVGCSAGLITSILAKRFTDKQFIGFDTSKDVAPFWSKNEADNLRFSSTDIAHVRQRFDLVLCLDVFEHVDDYIGFLKAVRQR